MNTANGVNTPVVTFEASATPKILSQLRICQRRAIQHRRAPCELFHHEILQEVDIPHVLWGNSA